MTLYAIGDLQGCADAFEALLETIEFDPAQDRLWLVGDFVNRGPASGVGCNGRGCLWRFVLHCLA